MGEHVRQIIKYNIAHWKTQHNFYSFRLVHSQFRPFINPLISSKLFQTATISTHKQPSTLEKGIAPPFPSIDIYFLFSIQIYFCFHIQIFFVIFIIPLSPQWIKNSYNYLIFSFLWVSTINTSRSTTQKFVGKSHHSIFKKTYMKYVCILVWYNFIEFRANLLA